MSHSMLLLLLLLSGIWGASYLFIKIGVSEIGPLTFGMSRVLIGSAALFLFVGLRRERLPTDLKTWARYSVMGLLNAFVPFSIIGWGARFIPSGLSAILGATMPLFTFILATLWGTERLRWSRALGVLIGFGGILVLTLPQLRAGMQASLWGELAVILGSFSYAVAAVYARRNLAGHSPVAASLGQVFTGFLFFIPVALPLERPWTQPFSLRVTLSLLVLGVLGTAIAYVLYHRLIQGIGATGASLVTYVAPVFGVFWGWVILGERLPWNAFVALLLILLGLVLVNDLWKMRPGRQPAPTPAQKII